MTSGTEFDNQMFSQIGGMVESIQNLKSSIDHSRTDANDRFSSLMDDVKTNKKSFDEFRIALQNDFYKVKITVMRLQWGLVAIFILTIFLVAPTNPLVANTIMKFILP